MTDKQAIAIASKIADGIYYMHSQNPIVIHQDLKPNVLVSNIYLPMTSVYVSMFHFKISNDLDEVYVCDLGIAKVKVVAETTRTSVTKGPGTYPYMAPEMFQKSHHGPAVDIYSFGCLLIELFGRRRVWPGLDAPDIMLCVMCSYSNPPQMPNTSHLNDVFMKVCTCLCQLEPSARPTSAEVVQLLMNLKC